MLGVAARGPKWLVEGQACTKSVQDSLVREDVLIVQASLVDGEAVVDVHGAALYGRR